MDLFLDNQENEEHADTLADTISTSAVEGKCQYDRSFLLQLQFAKASMTKPNALPNLPDVILDKPYSREVTSTTNFEPRYNMPDFTFGYACGPKF
ncbi:eukaryotic translation initiation factor 4 gamma 3-like [Gigantopelta aegis]|uniref:eukaryotic translation initiation factor 4 gamma 3-like n=1 Tax=Gigantopelta aegis TaxID=1735272 RepID=UPI001B889DBB|nr:eukaryotic translation initiation factor 4 gamma 3-like [Gigantopelta aegis]